MAPYELQNVETKSNHQQVGLLEFVSIYSMICAERIDDHGWLYSAICAERVHDSLAWVNMTWYEGQSVENNVQSPAACRRAICAERMGDPLA